MKRVAPDRQTYNTWYFMKQRCDNPQRSDYQYYGGRGITYDPRWADIENFLADMGPRPADLTLERRDNDLGYSKENCYWATRSTQALNRSIKATNTSGVTGVYWHARSGKWKASIMIDGARINLGSFAKFEDAVAVRQDHEAAI